MRTKRSRTRAAYRVTRGVAASRRANDKDRIDLPDGAKRAEVWLLGRRDVRGDRNRLRAVGPGQRTRVILCLAYERQQVGHAVLPRVRRLLVRPWRHRVVVVPFIDREKV